MDKIAEQLRLAGQEPLANHFLSLNEASRSVLLRDIQTQDFEYLKKLHSEKSSENLNDSISDDFTPMPFKLSIEDQRLEYWEETGKILLDKGQVAAFLVAGGQG